LGLGLLQPAEAGSLVIPTHVAKRPAGDLLYRDPATGKVTPIDSDEALQLSRSHDISRLDPMPNDVWSPSALPVSDEERWSYPPEGTVLTYQASMPRLAGVYRANLDLENGDSFHMIASRQSHSALIRAGLLRKMGYAIQSPKYYSQLRVRFGSIAARDEFLFLMADDTLVKESYGREQYLKVLKDRWLGDFQETDLELVIRDVVLQPARVEIPPFQWATVKADQLLDRRALRGLIVPFVLCAVPESINRYGGEIAKVMGNYISLLFPMGGIGFDYNMRFREVTQDDVRWGLRKLGTLERKDWKEIVALAHFPTEVDALVLEKIIELRNHLIAVFGLSGDFPALPYDLKITLGSVKKGKLTQARFPGYANHFSQGDAPSPLRLDDMLRFFQAEFEYGVGLDKLTDWLNKKIPGKRPKDAIEKHRDELERNIRRHRQLHGCDQFPGAYCPPYAIPLRAWGGKLAGLSISATRNVITGGYYGNQAPVQLVDSVGVELNLGYFLAVDGMPKLNPGLNGNVIYRRDYVHVRPVQSIQAALKEDPESLIIPHDLRSLANLLKFAADEKDQKKMNEQLMHNNQELLKNFAKGETFIVNDVVGASLGGHLNIPILDVLGAVDSNLPHASIGMYAGKSLVTVQKTYITREDVGDNANYVVYLSDIDTRSRDTVFDVNFWINLLRVSHSKKSGGASTRVYPLTVQRFYLPKDFKPEPFKKVSTALAEILRSNSTSALDALFSPITLDHEFKSKINRKTVLYSKADKLEEKHRLRVRPQMDEDNPNDPRVPENRQFERTLYAERLLRRTGQNYYGLFSSILEKLTGGWAPKSNRDGENPAYTFLGRGKWSSVSTEIELTEGFDQTPVSYLENYWVGWKISKGHLFEILDRIEETLKGMPMNVPPVRREVFNNMTALFLYEVRSTLTIQPEAVKKIRDLLLKENEKTSLQRLISMWGAKNYEAYKTRVQQTEKRAFPSGLNQTLEVYRGLEGVYEYVPDWIGKVLDLRKEYVRLKGKGGAEDKEAEVHRTNRLLDSYAANLGMKQLLELIGPENFFFVLKVSGFRTDDQLKDSDYLSNTVGTPNSDRGPGGFSEILAATRISEYVLKGKFFNEGF
jgi:hypothetical protein